MSLARQQTDYFGTNFSDDSFLPLIEATVTHAFNRSSFYRSAWHDGPPTTLSEFRSLPTLTRQQIVDNHEAIIASSLECQRVVHTSGTTGHPLLIPRSREEIEHTNRILRTLSEADRGQPRPIGVTARDNVHGIGGQYYSHVVWMGDPSFSPASLDLAVHYLNSTFEIPGLARRASLLFMSLLELLHFSRYAEERGLPTRETGLEQTLSTGFPLTRTWLKTIESTWDCPHTHAYSLSELFGQATTCRACGQYHNDAFSFVEFLDPLSSQPIEKGVARLVATTLFPYTQMFPLIRYETGDLVEVANECRFGLGFLPLGRSSRALRDDGGVPIVFPSDILEVLSDVDWVDRALPHALASLRVPGCETFGVPKFTFHGGSEPAIRVHLREGTRVSRRKLDDVAERLVRAVDVRHSETRSVSVQVQFDENPFQESQCVYGCPTAARPRA